MPCALVLRSSPVDETEGCAVLVVIQFPIADVRPFVDELDNRLEIAQFVSGLQVASFDHPEPGEPEAFIPFTGPLRKRHQGAQFLGETLYFKASQAIRFPHNFRTVSCPRTGASFHVDVFFRRYQGYDEPDHRLVRIDVGLSVTPKSAAHALLCEANPPQPDEILPQILRTLVTVEGWPQPVPLMDAGEALAAHVRKATTPRQAWAVSDAAPWTAALPERPRQTPRHWTDPAPERWKVQACPPMVLVEYGRRELALPDSETLQTVDAGSDGVALAFARPPALGGNLHTWFLSTGAARVAADFRSGQVDAKRHHTVRHVRINLFRHHAEREALAFALQCITRRRQLTCHGDGMAAQRLRAHLLKLATALSNPRRYSLQQAVVASATQHVEAAAHVVDQVDRARLQVLNTGLLRALPPETYALLKQLEGKGYPMDYGQANLEIDEALMAARPPPMKLVISYAHADERRRAVFAQHVQQAEQEGLLAQWHDHFLCAGDDWDETLAQQFKTADIIVLLISPDFLKSSYCAQREIPWAMARFDSGEAAVLPVLLFDKDGCEAAFAQTPLARVQALLKPHGQPVTRGNEWRAWQFVMHAIVTAACALQARRVAGLQAAVAAGQQGPLAP
jgi:hypothetical protein